MSAIAQRRTLRPALAITVAAALTLAGCSNMSNTEQRALTGTVGGAGVGAIIGAIGGNAGLGGLIYDHVKKEERAQYDRGYEAGRHKHRPTPPSG
jgi:hypothetical protein